MRQIDRNTRAKIGKHIALSAATMPVGGLLNWLGGLSERQEAASSNLVNPALIENESL